MKIISLNTWGGRAGREKLLSFFETHRDIDVFCLQEIWSAPYEFAEGMLAGGKAIDHSEIMTHGMQDISAALPDHTAYFRPHHLENYGLLMLVSKRLSILEEGETFVHKHKNFIPEGDLGHHARNIQYIRTVTNDRPVTVINFHGLWMPTGKGDTPDRITQSKNIINFLKGEQGDIIMCGDFNLMPNTQSITMLEDFGLHNLITENHVTSTRTSYYTRDQKYADYFFVSKGLTVQDFTVLLDEVSDHAPLYLEVQ